MKNTLTIFIFILLSLNTFAQKTVAVLSGTTWTFYDDFSPALRAAPSGATIYVPGGTFDLGGSDTINKPITIIGTGHYYDSAAATLPTVLLGSIDYGSGANLTNLQGLDITGGISILSGAGVINNNSIFRCRVRGSISLYSGSTTYFNHTLISESVIYTVYQGSINSDLQIEKCIILNLFFGLNGAIIKNNYFLNSSSYIGNSYNNTIFNNVFIGSASIFYVSSDNVFFNNYVPTGAVLPTVNSYNNIFGATLANTFVNVTSTTYNQNFDYHLKTGSAAINAGSDGTNMGIYGTAYPCKDGWVPPNPHISTKSISSTSAANGTLPVNIKVIAQDR